MPVTNMKLIRKQKGWTQSFVAEKIGLTITSVSDIENCKAKPSYEVLCKLEDLFEMDHRRLFSIHK